MAAQRQLIAETVQRLRRGDAPIRAAQEAAAAALGQLAFTQDALKAVDDTHREAETAAERSEIALNDAERVVTRRHRKPTWPAISAPPRRTNCAPSTSAIPPAAFASF